MIRVGFFFSLQNKAWEPSNYFNPIFSNPLSPHSRPQYLFFRQFLLQRHITVQAFITPLRVSVKKVPRTTFLGLTK